MSFRVELRLATEADAYCAADCMWACYPWPKQRFEWLEYRGLVVEEVTGRDAFILYRGDLQVGWAAVLGAVDDIHLPGLGMHVVHLVTRPDYSGASAFLLRHLLAYARKNNLAWINTTNRISELEFRSKFHLISRRPHGQSV